MNKNKKSNKLTSKSTSNSDFGYEENFKKICEMLKQFGLSSSEAAIYTFLSKYGKKTAPQIFKSLKIPRTETYRILRRLQGKGLITSSLTHPMNYASLSINDALELLLSEEKNRISNIESQKPEILEMWNKIPSNDSHLDTENRFQILKGQNQTNNKIRDMISTAKTKIEIMGTKEDFLHFHRANLFEKLKKSKASFRILTDGSQKTKFFLKDIEKKSIKRSSSIEKRGLCFALIDGSEVLFFIKNSDFTKDDLIAVWSDSRSIVNSYDMLFDGIWNNYQVPKGNEYAKIKEIQSEYQFRLKELKQENLALAEINKLLDKKFKQ